MYEYYKKLCCTSPYIFMAICLINHKENFIFLFAETRVQSTMET
jgi:hypothetical protein